LSEIIIFGDGACRGNPGPGGWGFILMTSNLYIEKGGRSDLTTNNEMEIMALLEALKMAQAFAGESRQMKIYFDSQYVLKGASTWIWSWMNSGWKTKSGDEVKNKELWIEISKLLIGLKKQVKIDWFYVEGHSGNPGNNRVDQIAASFADGAEVYLEDCQRKPHHQAIWDAQKDGQDIREISSSFLKANKSEKKKTYYLSVVGGKVYRDETWESCEARVKGVTGAKYKKVKSQSEEESTLKSWGFD